MLDISRPCLTHGSWLPLLELLQLLELLELLFFRRTAALVAGYKVSRLLYSLRGCALGRRDVDPVPRCRAPH
jgi:hypothetical protein